MCVCVVCVCACVCVCCVAACACACGFMSVRGVGVVCRHGTQGCGKPVLAEYLCGCKYTCTITTAWNDPEAKDVCYMQIQCLNKY